MPAPTDFISEGSDSIRFDGNPIRDAWNKACGIDAGYKALINAINHDSALSGANPELADKNSAEITQQKQDCIANGPPADATVESIERGIAPQKQAIGGYTNLTVF